MIRFDTSFVEQKDFKYCIKHNRPQIVSSNEI